MKARNVKAECKAIAGENRGVVSPYIIRKREFHLVAVMIYLRACQGLRYIHILKSADSLNCISYNTCLMLKLTGIFKVLDPASAAYTEMTAFCLNTER